MPHRCLGVLLVLCIVWAACPPVSAAGENAPRSYLYLITLAGEEIEIQLPIPDLKLIQAMPGDAVQAATAVRWEPFFEVSLSTNPVSSTASQRMEALQSLRKDQAAHPLASHRISFWGQPSQSFSNQVMISLKPAARQAVIIHEWIASSNSRLWTFRVSYTPGQIFNAALLDEIVIRSVGSTSVWEAGRQRVERAGRNGDYPAVQPLAEDDLPAPDWWDGDCDTNHYEAETGLAAYPLGGIYRGVKACGPRPWYDDAPDVLVRFFEGAWGENEWECVELSMRYLYLAYHIPPYPADGKDVVANYPGTLLVKVSNGTAGRGPAPGDVLSYGATTEYGHTSVVSEASIDEIGNGAITVIEQNASETGEKTLAVAGWYVQASVTVSGWLHDPVENIELPEKVYLQALFR